MGSKSEEIIDKATKDPEKFYKNPERILLDNRLTAAEKGKILCCWELDQLALMRAEEENMLSKINAPSPVDLLEKVKAAEKELESCKGKLAIVDD